MKFYICLIVAVSVIVSGGFCNDDKDNKIVNYEFVKDIPNHPEILLIDVRLEQSVNDNGKIPTSINIPFGVLAESLKLSEEAFKTKYAREKPTFETPIVFYCKTGKRAAEAAELTESLGFKNVRYYEGSWKEWAEKEGLTKPT